MEIPNVPSSRPKALERALVDIEQGRLWMARDRLGSYLKGDPVHPAVRDLYGEVLYRMGDWPMAGRAWYLTDRDDEAARASIAAFESKFPNPVVRALAVGRALDGSELPPAAAKRAAHLKDQLPTGFAWPAGQRGMPTRPESKLGNAAGIFVLILVFALICVVLAGIGLGLIQIGRATIEWIGGLFGR
ncbi:MAG: DUF6584 family protein [Acidimicrobiia bacterium]